MEPLLRDLRDALRQPGKSPAFVLIAVLTLAFGIGATTAIFSIVEGVLLRPLPFSAPARLITLGDTLEGVEDSGDAPGVTAPGVRTYLRDTHAFSNLGGYTPAHYELSGVGTPAQINWWRLTASMFPTLALSPLKGRIPNILGQKLLLDRKPYESIGVMPRSFEFPLVPGQLSQRALGAKRISGCSRLLTTAQCVAIVCA